MPQFSKLEASDNGATDVVTPMELSGRVAAYDRMAKLPDDVEAIKRTGNDFLENEKYLQAIYQYTMAIERIPNHPVFYLNRATAYMRRSWFGDIYAGLRDCQTALTLDPMYEKAHFRLARALFELGYVNEASECLQELRNRFPGQAKNKSVVMLLKEIEIEQKRAAANAEIVEDTGLDLSAKELVRFCPSLLFVEYFLFVFFLLRSQQWRAQALDYAERFVGHCNTTTDIKEANYFGDDGNFVIAG